LWNLDEVFQHVTTSIYPNWVWQNNLHFFLELHKPWPRISRCGDENFRISIFGLLILIIDGCPSGYSVVIPKIGLVNSLILFLPPLIWNLLVVVDCFLNLDTLLLVFLLLRLLGFSV
jgi:hypothetical protein